jgi:soluble lytic murein transglycosylase-like protein
MGDKNFTIDDFDSMVGKVKEKTAPTDKKMKLRVSKIEHSMDRLSRIHSKLQKAADKHAIPVEILAAIADRESGVGSGLDVSGWDMGKNAYGIMQVDKRFHNVRGKTPDSQEHINQAAEILRQARNDMDRKFPKDTDEQRWQSAIAAYNTGAGRVKSHAGRDRATAGHDYSADVWERATDYRERTQPKPETNVAEAAGVMNVDKSTHPTKAPK